MRDPEPAAVAVEAAPSSVARDAIHPDAADELPETPERMADALGDPGAPVRRLRLITTASILALFAVVVPLLNAAGVIQDYKVNILGKYLCLAIVALGLDLVWGYTGLLSLCQAMFFCLGGYIMAMHLSLPEGGGDVRPEYHNIPQFMFFNNVHELPGFWKPFASFGLTLTLGPLIPGLLATVLGFFILRSRVRGVYFSIITQALVYGVWLLISRNEMLMGGTNGLTNFSKAFTERRGWIIGLYLLTLVVLLLAYLLCRGLARSRLGRVLVAIRDRESRLYFAGYKPYAFKVFAFAVGAMLGALGGMLYAPQVGIVTPQDLAPDNSILVVACVAVGGRGRLWGAVLGALVVMYSRAALTTDMSGVWLYFYGALFLAVVLFFPDGLVGLWDTLEQQVSGRAGRAKVALAATPLAALAAFVLAQALGLMPAFLDHGVRGIPAKYLCLFILFVIPFVTTRIMRRQDAARAAAPRFPIAVAAGAGRREATP